MNYSEVRKQSLRLFIGFLGFTALIAIISVVTGEFGNLQVKILATCFTISAASICSMSCAAFIEKKKQTELGLSGIVLSIVASILVITGIWVEIDNSQYWKTAVTTIIFTVAFAHAFLLSLPDLDKKHRWAQLSSAITIGILALIITLAVWIEIDSDLYFRFVSVVAIIVGLETLVIPILMKLRKEGKNEHLTLILENIEGDIYRDTSGNEYKVNQIIKD